MNIIFNLFFAYGVVYFMFSWNQSNSFWFSFLSMWFHGQQVLETPPLSRPFLISYILPSWRAVRAYGCHLEVRDPIWEMAGRIAFIILSPTWFSVVFLSRKVNARWSVPNPSSLSWADRRYARGKWSLARNPHRRWWHRNSSLKLFCPQPMAPWAAG